ncbi:MAG: phage tail tape measure protein [Ruminococcus sp.]|nr:phage tail tape measure protein [Ruminococcus sp.]
MAEEKALVFDTGIDKSRLEKGLAEIEEAIASTATVSEKKAEAAFENMEKQAKRLAKAYEDAGMDASEAMQKAWKDVQANADAFGTNATENFKNVGTAAENAGTSIESLSGKLQSALATAGLAYGAKEITEIGTDYEQAMKQVAAVTGAGTEEMDAMSDSIQKIYTSGIGKNLEEVAGAAALVKQQFGDMDSSTLEQITQDAIAMPGIFGTDLNETLRGVNALMSNMGLSAEEAFDYIAKGTQNGLDKSGELSDNLAEYSQIWEQAGFSAEEMFSILQNGLDSGAYNLDKVNDFVKEFSISLSDGRIEENVDKFSLGTRNLFAEWQNGKASQKDVFNSIISDLSNMTDQQEALSIASSVWSALGEDNAMKVITSLNNVNDTYSDVKGTTESIEEINYDNFADKTAALKRQVEMDVIIPITQKYMPKIEKAIDYVSEHLDEIVEHAKPIAAGIAAAFAVKKILDFGTTTVNTVKTIKTAFQILNASNPLGWIALGIGAVVSVGSVLIADAKKKAQEWKDHLEDVRDSAAKIPDEVQKSIEKTQECTQAWEEMHQKISQDGMVEDSDYEAVNQLKDSLMALINADGTIKTGQEEKVQSLIDQLDEYSYTGLTVSDGLIQKNGEVVNSYSKIAGAIDEVIDKQHAQNYLDMLGEASKQAQQERPALLQAVTEQNQELQAKKEERQQIIDEMAQFKLDNTYTLTDINGKTESIWNDTDASKTYDEMREKLNGVNDSIQTLSTTYYESTTQLEKGADAMHAYKEAAEAYASGDLDTVTQAFSDLQNNVLTASTATAEQLKAQEEEARTHYETLKQMAEEKPGSVLAEDLNDAKRLAEDAAVELEIKTGEHADNAGKTFLDTLSASGMSEGEKLDALNRYIEERLNNGDNLNKIAQDIGLDYDSGFATGITDNAGMVEEAVKALGKVAEAHLRISIDSHSPSKLSKSIGGDWDEGFAIGIEEGIPDVSTASADMANTAVSSTLDTMNAHGGWDKSFAIGIREGAPGVSAVSANMANAAVSSTLGIMNAQGAAAVSAYSPVLQQAYAAPAAASTSTAAPSNSQPQGDIIIPINIGDETLETVVVNAITRANANSGGWSV